MKHSRMFIKARAIAFSVITFVSFVWATLFCVFLSVRWFQSSETQRSFVAGFLALDVITAITLPILLICEFRPYLDAARMTFLLIFHFGLAGAFAVASKTITCDDTSLDGPGLCQLFNLYIIISSWILPVMLLAYFVCLAWYNHHNKRIRAVDDTASTTSSTPSYDLESGKKSWKRATLPIMEDDYYDARAQPTPAPAYSPANKPAYHGFASRKPPSPRPALSITIPPVANTNRSLPTILRTPGTRSAVTPGPRSVVTADARSALPTSARSPFAPRPAPTPTASSSNTSRRSSANTPTASKTPTSARRQTLPALVLHDGDRAAARTYRPSMHAHRASAPRLEVPVPPPAQTRFGTYPSRAHVRHESVPGATRHESVSGATWGWAVPFTGKHASASGSSASGRSSAQLLTPTPRDEDGKARLTKQMHDGPLPL